MMAVLSWVSYLQLIACALSPAIIAILLHFFLKKWKWFQARNYWIRQVSIGVAFSLLALCSFVFGVQFSAIPGGLYEGVVGTFGSANASPLIAGLVFGGPSGLIAGFLAGIYRLVLYRFGTGDYLRAAECISVLLSGGLAWLLRATLFDNKKPKWFYGLIVGVLIETMHMLLVFGVSIGQQDAVYAYGIVRACDIPCFITVGLSIMIALIGIALVEKEKLINRVKGGDKRIATKIQRWLGLTFFVAIVCTFGFTYWGNYQKTAYDVGEHLSNGNVDVKDQVKTNHLIRQPDKTILEDEDRNKVIKEIKNSNAYYVTRFQRIGKEGFALLVDGNTNMIVSVPSPIELKEGDYEEYLGQKVDVKTLYPNSNEYYETTLPDGLVYYAKWDEIKFTTEQRAAGGGDVNFIVLSYLSRTEARLEMGIVVRVTQYLELLVFVGIFGVIYVFIKRVVVSNVHKINESLDMITGGNLNVKVEVRSNKEFSDLSDDINQTVDTLKKFIEEANKRIDVELQYAKTIQQSSLPIIFPTTSAYDLYATMHTAKQVGGDFYDFFPVDNNHLFFLIADVSGKGIPAAMFMMRAKTLVKSLVQTNELTLDNIIAGVNDELNHDNEAGMFVTSWFGLLNTDTGELEFVNAGHCRPLIYRAENKKYTYLDMATNCVLGVMPNMSFKLEKIKLNSNDGIILYTDGVSEATNKRKKLYGEPRLLEFVNTIENKTSAEVLDTINREIDAFQSGAEQADDITMLMVRYKPMK